MRQLDPPKVLYVNDRYVQLTGFDPTMTSEAQMESAMQGVDPDDGDPVMADYWQRAAAGLSAQAEMRIIQPSGEVRWLRLTTNPVRAESGTPALAAGTIEDITARKIAEAAMQSARRDANGPIGPRANFFPE